MHRKVYYRLSANEDPEERLEDAALWKAMHDEYGDSIALLGTDDAIPDDAISGQSVFFGRTKRGEFYTSTGNGGMDYWNDPAFKKYAARETWECDVADAERVVKTLQSSGKGAFIKAKERKYFTGKVAQDEDFEEFLGAMVYSFIDRGACLLVQPLCTIEFEQRFIFIRRQLAAKSPIAYWLTPLDKPTPEEFARTPSSRNLERPEGVDLTEFAQRVAMECRYENVNIDCAWVNGKPGVVEFNDAHLGQLGLYACDVRSLARHSRWLIPEEPALSA